MIAQIQTVTLRRVLVADALVSGATGLLMFSGAAVLTNLLSLPELLLRCAGLALIPFAAFVAVVATRSTISRAAVWAVVIVNALWVLDSVLVLFIGWFAPTMLGLWRCAVPSTRGWRVRWVAIRGAAQISAVDGLGNAGPMPLVATGTCLYAWRHCINPPALGQRLTPRWPPCVSASGRT